MVSQETITRAATSASEKNMHAAYKKRGELREISPAGRGFKSHPWRHRRTHGIRFVSTTCAS